LLRLLLVQQGSALHWAGAPETQQQQQQQQVVVAPLVLLPLGPQSVAEVKLLVLLLVLLLWVH
jgi:hypothetical protein